MKKLYKSTHEPEKSLIEILPKKSGRDNRGHVSVRHQGGRQKRYYRIIDFKRDLRNIPGTIKTIEYDPNRNAFISLIEYQNGEKRYILYPHGASIGDEIISAEVGEIKAGNAMPLKNIPLGVEIHNVELYPGKGAKLVRAAGSFATIVAKEDKYAHIKLGSREVRKVLINAWATIGRVGNITAKDEEIGKAGRMRLMGIRPTVRGTAQNPKSHPHGGGEGRTGEGMHPKTPWGKPARGKKTRNPKNWSNPLIVSKRK